MSLRHLLVFSMLVALCPFVAFSQQSLEWQQWVDQYCDMADDNSADLSVEALAELYEYYSNNPINLNDTVGSPLLQLPFVSQFHQLALNVYISLHGQLFSVDELLVINGFSPRLVALLRPLVTAHPVSYQKDISLKQRLKNGKFSLLTGVGSNFQTSRGVSDDIYAGNDLHLYGRISYTVPDFLTLQLSADKDPGEALFGSSQPYGFDFYGGYLSVSNVGRLNRIVLGQYNLQFGQGLALWSGFAPFSLYQTDLSRTYRGIYNASAFTEYGYLNGVAADVRITSRLSAVAFFSSVSRDATVDTLGQVRSIYASGYHRTASELAKKDFFDETLYGLHLQFQATNLQIGMTGYVTCFAQPIVPRSYRYNYYAFSGSENENLSIDFRYRRHRSMLFGEAAVSRSGGKAVLLGSTFFIDPDNSLGLCFRWFDPSYYSFFAAPTSCSSSASNEQSASVSYQTLLPLSLRAFFQASLFRFPSLSYKAYAPSSGVFYRSVLSYDFARSVQLQASYSYRSRSENASLTDCNTYSVEQVDRHILSLTLQCQYMGFNFRTRLAHSWLSPQYSEPSKGLLLFQDIQYTFSRPDIVLSARFALFDVGSYDARLTAAESDMAYLFASTSYYGTGQRFYLVARYNISRHLSIAAKYAVTTYAHATTVGSSYQQTDGDTRSLYKCQLRWNF